MVGGDGGIVLRSISDIDAVITRLNLSLVDFEKTTIWQGINDLTHSNLLLQQPGNSSSFVQRAN